MTKWGGCPAPRFKKIQIQKDLTFSIIFDIIIIEKAEKPKNKFRKMRVQNGYHNYKGKHTGESKG